MSDCESDIRATPLAKAWEKVRELRAAASTYQLVKATGKRVCRDTVRVNHRMLKLAIQHLGRRVAVPTLETHIESFYSYCKQPCSGTSIRRQAWVARRCMSEFNTIARRPHVPREMEIQGLLKGLGITLPKRIPLVIHESDEEASFGEEDAESESEEEEDQLVEPSREVEPSGTDDKDRCEEEAKAEIHDPADDSVHQPKEPKDVDARVKPSCTASAVSPLSHVATPPPKATQVAAASHATSSEGLETPPKVAELEALRAHRARLQRMLKVKQLIELQLKLKDLMLAKQNSQEVPNPENDHSAPKEKCIDNVDTLPMDLDNHFEGQAPADSQEEVNVEICRGKVSFEQETEKGERGEPCLKIDEGMVGEKASKVDQHMPPPASDHEGRSYKEPAQPPPELVAHEQVAPEPTKPLPESPKQDNVPTQKVEDPHPEKHSGPEANGKSPRLEIDDDDHPGEDTNGLPAGWGRAHYLTPEEQRACAPKANPKKKPGKNSGPRPKPETKSQQKPGRKSNSVGSNKESPPNGPARSIKKRKPEPEVEQAVAAKKGKDKTATTSSRSKRGAQELPEEMPDAPPQKKTRKVDMSDKEKLRSKKCSAYTRTLQRERKKGTPEEKAKSLAKEAYAAVQTLDD